MSKPTHRSIAIASPYRRGLVELRHRLAADLAASNLARIRQVAAATVSTADPERDGSDGAVFPVRTDPQRDSR